VFVGEVSKVLYNNKPKPIAQTYFTTLRNRKTKLLGISFE